MRTQEWKEEQIKILKEIQAEKPNATFWSVGYCPQEGESDEDTNENGQYWTDWDGLTAEELLDKLEDDHYDIEDWDEEEEIEQEFNKNLDKLANDDELWMNCTYKYMDKNGNYVQCSTKVLKKNIDKNNQNNNYCSWHQEFVDEINKQRKLQAIKEYQEQIIKYCNNKIQEQKSKTFTLNYLVKKDYVKENEIINSKSINIGFEVAYEFLIEEIQKGEFEM